jgi:spore coat protein A
MLNTSTDLLGNRFVPNVAAPGGSLILAGGERLDFVVDFNGKAGKKYILFNDAPGPFPTGDALNDYYKLDGTGPDTSILMRFEVKADSKAIPADAPFRIKAGTPLAGVPDAKINPPLAGPVANALPATLSWATATTAPLPIPTRKGITVRQLTLNETTDASGRLIQMLGTNIATSTGDFSRPYWDPTNATTVALSAATETTNHGATEVWQIANLTGDTHPIHFHLVNVQILSRQAFDTNVYAGVPAGAPAGTPGTIAAGTPGPLVLLGAPRGPEAMELGWKETIKMHPGEVTTVIMKVDLPVVPFVVPPSPRTGGNEFVWHCHILEHEEHDMMRTLVVK